VNTVAAGMGLGALASTSLVVALTGTPPLRRPRLDDRLSPYLRDAPRPSRLLVRAPSRTPFPTVERLLAPVLADLARGVDRLVGGGNTVRRRLEAAGRDQTLEDFRVEQVVWGAVGLLAGLAVTVLLLVARDGANPVPLVALCLLTTTVGVLARDRWLTRDVRRRDERMLAEFPTIAELIALAVAAGDGPVGALERVSRLSAGELSGEIRRALAETRAGAPLAAALTDIGARTSLAQLARFVDGIAIAIERGTPLAEVLRAQAVDVREAGKRALLEAGGRKEIAMLVPVVFLILPVTILFAVYPGFYGVVLNVP